MRVEDLSQGVATSLAKAGWRPGRVSQKVAEWAETLERSIGLPMPPTARNILTELGELRIGDELADMEGEECAPLPIWMNPLVGYGRRPILENAARAVGVRWLFPLGEISHALLVVADDGRLFATFGDAIWLVGRDLREVLETTLRGQMLHQRWQIKA
jgi:hypothetical protein